MKTKISGTGYLCAWNSFVSEWVIICKLTPDQIHEYWQVQKMLDRE